MARLQKEAKVFMLMKYRERYKMGHKANHRDTLSRVKSLRTDQGTTKVLDPHASSTPDASATTMVVGASWILQPAKFLLTASRLKLSGLRGRSYLPRDIVSA